jgi:hypothetical protein
VDEKGWEAAHCAAAEAHADLGVLIQEFLGRVADGAALAPPKAEAASRNHLPQLLKECRVGLDGRPTRESFYTDRRFH